MYQIKGKIDSNNSPKFEKEIMAALPNEIDAAELEYISSAGLRVLLKLRKTVGEVTVCNVSPEVYEIFDVTGFTDIINVKKALREVSVEGCELIGEGGNGAVYRLNEDTIVKVYKADIDVTDLDDINREREYARTAFLNGIPSVIAYDMVKVGDRGQIVIPKHAREVFDIKAGDRVMVMGDTAKGGIALAKVSIGKLFGKE